MIRSIRGIKKGVLKSVLIGCVMAPSMAVASVSLVTQPTTAGSGADAGPGGTVESWLATMPVVGGAGAEGFELVGEDVIGVLKTMPGSSGDGGFSLGSGGPLALGSFNIVINAGPGLAGNAAALAAFERAASQWEAFISDPITVTIDADLVTLSDPGVIGQTSPRTLTNGFTTIRNAMVADADADDAILASLPTVGTFSAFVPVGFDLSGGVTLTKANAKALGFANLDMTFGARDATIVFNTGFSFDFDNSDGVGPGLTDFETTAAHEIGHALGFVSAVDEVDAALDNDTPIFVSPTPLDLFRFIDGLAGSDPETAAEFTTGARNLVPGFVAVTDTVLDEESEFRMSTGRVFGDGRQASHWRDDALSGDLIGMMDPTLAPGAVFPLTFADMRAFDLIGYDIVVPEPSTAFVLVGLGLSLAGAGRRRGRMGTR